MATALLCFASALGHASTIITNTRTEIAFMAKLWEADSLQISSLVNAQYPQFSTDWQYIFPHANLAADCDVHCDMAGGDSPRWRNHTKVSGAPRCGLLTHASHARTTQYPALQ